MPLRFVRGFICFLFLFLVLLVRLSAADKDSHEKEQGLSWSIDSSREDKNEHPGSKNVKSNILLPPPPVTRTPWQWNPYTRTITVKVGTTTTSKPSTTSTATTTTTTPTTTSPAVYNLKKPARQALRNILRGVAPEKRKKQLKQMGKKIKVEKITKNQSKKLHKTYRKVIVTQQPALDMFEVNQRAGLNDYLFQGDINLDESQIAELPETCSGSTTESGKRKKRQIRNSAKFWPNNVVNYYFDSGLSSTMQSVVIEAMEFLQSKTCITFSQDKTATNRVKIFDGVGCYSNVGMLGGEQSLSLGSGCGLVGTAAHELAHTLGVFHSQMRYDRDDFVTVDLTDVPVDSQSNFVKFTPTTSTNLVTYEYGSFMHYGGRAFVTSGGVDSIVPKDPLMIYTMGGRIITFMDIKMLNIHYSCSCPTSLSCGNGGYTNPANCNECLCPYGFGGTLCTEKANYTCGSILTATDTWQQESYTFGDSTNSATARPSFLYCNHWIKAPVGKVIQFRIDSTYNTQCGYGCTFNGIEPKLKTDQTMTQTRYCCNEFNGEIMTSEVNPLPVFTYNRYYITKYSFSYRYVDANITTTCVDLSDKDTCASLKKSYEDGCSLYDLSQLKVMCAVTMELCGKSTDTDCADRFTQSQCSTYSSKGMCTSQSPLISEFSCAATCGYCVNPV